jgi:hypothetical protein
MRHITHVPASMTMGVHRLEKLLGAVLFTFLPPVAFAMLILSGLLVALTVSKLF